MLLLHRLTRSGCGSTYSIYFKNVLNWTDVNAYYWGGTSAAPTWPGSPAEVLGDGYFMAVVPNDITGLIFNGKDGDSSVQTANIESDLADGKDSLDGLTKLIKGINQLLKGYKNQWRPGYEALKDGRNQLYKGSKDSKKDLTDLAAFLEDTDAQKAYVAAVDDVAGDDEKQGADDYRTSSRAPTLWLKLFRRSRRT